VRLTRRCNDRETVSEVLQDTFVAVWRGAGRFRGEGDVAAWIWGIAIRRLVTVLRGSAPLTVPHDENDVPRAWVPGAEEQVLLDVEYGDLGAALRSLSPQMRAVVQATLLDGLTAKEAAQLLGSPQNTVKTRLHRAKAQMRRALAEGRT
jgi:RNA polymerase sigma-70 factor (ECF subfamily)